MTQYDKETYNEEAGKAAIYLLDKLINDAKDDLVREVAQEIKNDMNTVRLFEDSDLFDDEELYGKLARKMAARL